MDWITFIHNIIESLAWPLVVLIAVMILRQPLIKLLPNLRRAKYKDLELLFGEKLEELEARAEQAELPEPEEKTAWVYQSPDGQ